MRTYFTTIKGDVKAVDGVSLEVSQGEILGLSGESGCGKTTLGLSIMKVLPPNGRIVEGRILFDDEDLIKKRRSEMKKIRWKKISIVFQGSMNALNPVIKVGDQITEAILAHENTSKADARKRVKKLLEFTGIDGSRVNDYPHELSGGMKQRVMIAMALACNPKLVIADEPTTALDVIVQGQILELIKELKERLNLSIMLITHDLPTISEVCNTVAIMYAGKIVEYSDAPRFFSNPRHPYSFGLLTAFPSIKGPEKKLTPIPGAPPNLINPPEGCRFHPRCPRAMDICSKLEPKMVEVAKRHYVACHLFGDVK